ncbi:MAG: DUF655 domain-containing protein [Candidatus Thermoplasmatota archaeon]|nr:DUF655 domain-containing protein [Candidatus Thermoplasmatota archaeon]
MEEFAYILDILPQGRMEEKAFRRVPLALAIGEQELKLFELVPKQGAVMTIGDKVYIGKDIEKRDRIVSVRRRISFEELTAGAQSEIEYVLKAIIVANESRFIYFFNNAQPITTRLHQLDLLYGVGRNLMWEIIDERKKGPFKDFADLKARIKGLRDPEKMIAERILRELKNKDEKHRLFVAN